MSEESTTTLSHEMRDFWNRVNMLLEQDEPGYLEIIADGVIYRSLPEDEYGRIYWVSWEPFQLITHFSVLADPNATVRRKTRGPADG